MIFSLAMPVFWTKMGISGFIISAFLGFTCKDF
jgi:hypothetical protein